MNKTTGQASSENVANLMFVEELLDESGGVDAGRPRRAHGWALTSVAAGIGVAFAIVATIALGGGVLSQGAEEPAADGKPASPEGVIAGFAAVAETIIEPGAGIAGAGRVEARDSQDNVINGADRQFATRWKGTYPTKAGGQVEAILIGEGPTTPDEAARDCSTRLESGYALSCETSVDGDVVRQFITRGAEQVPDGWPVVVQDRWNAQAQDLWMMQQVIARDSNGSTVYAYEVVRASDLAEARSRWSLSRQELADISSGLLLPMAGEDGDCGWVVAELRDAYACTSES